MQQDGGDRGTGCVLRMGQHRAQGKGPVCSEACSATGEREGQATAEEEQGGPPASFQKWENKEP